MRNVLITGANRGLGLGFVRHCLDRGDKVWACYRDDAGGLTQIDHPDCTALRWDVARSLEPSEEAKLPAAINLLINNAGIYGSKGGGQSLENVSEQEMLEVFRIDTVAPLRVVQQLLPRLKKGHAVIANMSSKMGSSSDNGSGGVYAYRAAKSALCIVSRSLAVDLAEDQIRVVCLHPGWVQTDMTNNTGLIDVDTSVSGLFRVVENVDDYPPGAFVAYDGALVPY